MLIVTIHEGEIRRGRHSGLPEVQSICGLNFVALAHDWKRPVSCRNCKRIHKRRRRR